MKSINKSIILNKIRTSGPISRAQIAKETKLTPPTVSSNVKELIEQGIVIESNLGESQGGRKPTMLLINYHSFYIIGINAGSSKIKCIISDLNGKIVRRHATDIQTPLSEEAYIHTIINSVKVLLNDESIGPGELIG